MPPRALSVALLALLASGAGAACDLSAADCHQCVLPPSMSVWTGTAALLAGLVVLMGALLVSVRLHGTQFVLVKVAVDGLQVTSFLSLFTLDLPHLVWRGLRLLTLSSANLDLLSPSECREPDMLLLGQVLLPLAVAFWLAVAVLALAAWETSCFRGRPTLFLQRWRALRDRAYGSVVSFHLFSHLFVVYAACELLHRATSTPVYYPVAAAVVVCLYIAVLPRLYYVVVREAVDMDRTDFEPIVVRFWAVYRGYRPEQPLFEMANLGRKTALAVVVAFSESVPEVQGTLGIAIVAIWAALVSTVKPYPARSALVLDLALSVAQIIILVGGVLQAHASDPTWYSVLFYVAGALMGTIVLAAMCNYGLRVWARSARKRRVKPLQRIVSMNAPIMVAPADPTTHTVAVHPMDHLNALSRNEAGPISPSKRRKNVLAPSSVHMAPSSQLVAMKPPTKEEILRKAQVRARFRRAVRATVAAVRSQKRVEKAKPTEAKPPAGPAKKKGKKKGAAGRG